METATTIGKLTATRRSSTGKEIASKLRARGLVPAVCYGAKAETMALTVDPVALRKALDPGKRQNTVIELTVQSEGQTETERFTVMLKEYQVDPLKRTVLHADFVRVAADQVVQVQVPLILEGKPEGVKTGGTLHQVFRTLPVCCTPDRIPTSISVDVSALNLGDARQVKDLTHLAEGVTVNLPSTQTIALVMTPRKVQEVVEAAPAEGAEGEKAEGEKAEEGEKPERGRKGKEE